MAAYLGERVGYGEQDFGDVFGGGRSSESFCADVAGCGDGGGGGLGSLWLRLIRRRHALFAWVLECVAASLLVDIVGSLLFARA